MDLFSLTPFYSEYFSESLLQKDKEKNNQL